jgi:hypothetical protein
MSFRSHQNSDHLPSLAVLPTSGDEYRLPSIGIRNRLPAKRDRSRWLWARHLSHDARSAFAFSQCSQPTVVNLPVNRHSLAPTYDGAPTQCFGNLSMAEIHSPPAFPHGTRSVGSSSLQSASTHPLYEGASRYTHFYADASLRPSAPKPEDCWLLLV